MPLPSITIIEAPSNLGLKPPREGIEPGVIHLPDAMRETSLYERLAVQHIERVNAPAYVAAIEPETGIRNAHAIRAYSIELANTIEQVLRDGQFPLVIGGDCSILLGSSLALRRIGSYGLLFLDGHTDFQTPEVSQTGGAAGMDLALTTGYGPTLLTQFEGYHPLIQEQNVIAVGFRDMDDPETYYAPLIFETNMQLRSLQHIRQIGIQQAIAEGIAYFKAQEVSGIWLHMDVDVLHDSILPAVDSRQPGGMTYEEMRVIIQELRQSNLFTGMQITILDPTLDPTGAIINQFADELAQSLAGL